MICRDLFDALYRLVAEELEAERRPHCDHHLCCCPSCAALVESYRLVIALAHALPPPPLPDGLASRLLVLLSREPTDH
jgi:anti-sigma factor RsiW